MSKLTTLTLLVALIAGCGDSAAPAPDSGTSADAALGLPDAAVDAAHAADASAADVGVDTGPAGDSVAGNPYPAPGDWSKNRGPGGPARTFAATELYKNCAFLKGGARDVDHHNLVVMFDGYLLMPWAPEGGEGGITFYDIKDPCNPKVVGSGFSSTMRESHSVGIAQIGGRWYAAVDGMKGIGIGPLKVSTSGGIEIWDITDTKNPKAISRGNINGFLYPDAYKRVVLSVFWQGRYIYAAGSENGVSIFDAVDPKNPKLVGHYQFTPIMPAGQVHAIGNLLIVTTAEQARTVLLDISDPTKPRPIPNGDFLIKDGGGTQRAAYFSNTGGGYIYYARKEKGGGVIVYDIKDPRAPKYAGDYASDGNGGYIFVKDNLAFVGESRIARIYDLSNLAKITEVASMNLTGDLDTVTPIGNVAVLAVDDKADFGKGSAIAPYAEKPDSTPPTVTWVYPPDGSKNLPTTSRVGVTFNEMVSPKSVWAGSVRLYKTGTSTAHTRVDGWVNAQENIVNFAPKKPLEPNTQYTLEIPAGGIVDHNGNAIAQPLTMTFTTGSK